MLISKLPPLPVPILIDIYHNATISQVLACNYQFDLALTKKDIELITKLKNEFPDLPIKLLLSNRKSFEMYLNRNEIMEIAHIADAKTLEYLKSKGIGRYINDADIAAKSGNLQVLKNLYSKGARCTFLGADWAVSCGHLEIIKYLESKGIRCLFNGVNTAAKNGHLEVAKYLESRMPYYRMSELVQIIYKFINYAYNVVLDYNKTFSIV